MIGDERRNDGKTNDDDRQFSIKSDRNGNDDREEEGRRRSKQQRRVQAKKERRRCGACESRSSSRCEMGESNIAISFEINWIEERTVSCYESRVRRWLSIELHAGITLHMIRCKHHRNITETKTHNNIYESTNNNNSLESSYMICYGNIYLSNKLLN